MILLAGNAEPPHPAHELIHQMQDDDQCREALNSVSYCFVLKGFAREEKLASQIQFLMQHGAKLGEAREVSRNPQAHAP